MNNEFNRNFVNNIIWSFIGRFGYLFVSLIANIVLARLLTPENFGQIAIIMFFIAIANVLTESGLSGAIVRKPDVTENDYGTMFVFNILVSLVLMALLIFASGYLAELYGDKTLKYFLIVSSFILLINSFKITQTTKLVKNLEFRKKAFLEFIAVIFGSLTAIIMATNGAGTWSLVAMQLLTTTTLTILMWFMVGPVKNPCFDYNSFKSLYKFGINTTLASILDSVFDNIYQLILGKNFNLNQTGLYYQAKKLQEVPVGIVTNTSINVVYSTLSLLQHDSKKFNATYNSLSHVFTVLVALICLIVFFYAENIIHLFYGAKWVNAATYMQVLILASFFNMQEMLNRNIFKIFNKTEKILQLEILKKLIQTITILYGLTTMSISNLLNGYLITCIISFLINYQQARNIQNNFSWAEALAIVKVILSAFFTILISKTLTEYLGLNGFYTFLILPFILALYFLLLWLSKTFNIVHGSKLLLALFIFRNKSTQASP